MNNDHSRRHETHRRTVRRVPNECQEKRADELDRRRQSTRLLNIEDTPPVRQIL
jgi:hypothetical protein